MLSAYSVYISSGKRDAPRDHDVLNPGSSGATEDASTTATSKDVGSDVEEGNPLAILEIARWVLPVSTSEPVLLLHKVEPPTGSIVNQAQCAYPIPEDIF